MPLIPGIVTSERTMSISSLSSTPIKRVGALSACAP
jgi:hypothetical protein